ncbi:MAG: ribonuclease R, partial [Firmicutes bacterium]|nr:ribonuclease R [Bacillota bacterium]
KMASAAKKRTPKKNDKKNSSRTSRPSSLFSSSAPVSGIIERHARGFGFLIIESSAKREDAYIPKEEMQKFVHGDRVEAVLSPRARSGLEAKIIKLLHRRNDKAVGTYYTEKSFGIVYLDDLLIGKEIFIPKGQESGAKHLDKVVVKIDWNKTNRGNTQNGQIDEVLGEQTAKGIQILSIIRSHHLYEEFPTHVAAYAKKVAKPANNQEKVRRVDFTNDLVFTIDGDDSKDFDDAVSLTKNENGNFILSVHIADVSHYVTENSPLDDEALKRGTSVYFCDRVLPMLPEELSNDICSLNEGVERLTLSIQMEIDNNGAILNHKISEGIIKSAARLTYSKVSAALSGDKEWQANYHKVFPTLQQLEILSRILFEKRKNRGNIDFDLPESQIILDEKGKTVDVKRRPRLIAHRIIEECMLAANESIAEFLDQLQAPGVFRVHDNPPQEKVESLGVFLAALAVPFESAEAPSPKDFTILLNSVKGTSTELAVSRMALRTMAKANYLPKNGGHFGLASPYYCHFTSPIRRYPDLAIHRIIKDYLLNGKKNFKRFKDWTIEAAKVSSERERAAEKAEREVDELKKAEYMEDKIGEVYTGVISGVSDFGFFVELENTVEGLVRAGSLKGERYNFNDKQMLLTNGAVTYRIGDKIEVKVKAVSNNKVEFELVNAANNKK